MIGQHTEASGKNGLGFSAASLSSCVVVMCMLMFVAATDTNLLLTLRDT